MANKLVQILLVGCLVGFTLMASTEIDTRETEVDTSETEVDICETVIVTTRIFEQNPDVVSQLKDEIHETRHWDEESKDHTIQISQADAERLLKIAYAEGGGEGIHGQLLIMQTVWNRVQSDDFPDTIDGVIHQKYAFSSVGNGHYDKAEPTWETHEALAQFESNLCHDDDLIGFETRDNGAVLLKYFDFLYAYGNHNFYTKKMD